MLFRLMVWWEYCTLRKYIDLLKTPRYTYWRLKRIVFEKSERSVVERAKLKCDLGIPWNEIEKKAIKKVLDWK